jgi:hypothetical protein
MTLYQAIERPLRASHGKKGVSGSSPLLGLSEEPASRAVEAIHGGACFARA